MPRLVDMARTTEEMKDASPLAMPNVPLYDYGLTLCFSQETMDRLNLDDEDVEVGDLLDTRMLLKVTSVSKNDTGDGQKCRIELQATHIAVLENESNEYEAD